MKRFSLIFVFAACFMMMFAASASAVWDVTIEDKPTVSVGQTGVDVSVFASFDLPLVGITVPLVVREIDAGSFWTGALPYDTGGNAFSHPYQFNVSWNWDNAWAALIEEYRPGVPGGDCPTDGDVGYDGVAPDHFVLNGAGAGGSEPAKQDHPFITFSFDVTSTPGDFEIDTACFTNSLNTIFMIDNQFPPIDHGPSGLDETSFDPGLITINPNLCPDVIGAYDNSNVSGTEGDLLTNTHDGNYDDPDGDPALFYLDSGPGAITDPSTGAWEWQTDCCDEGQYTVNIVVSDQAHPGPGGCNPDNLISFTVNVDPTPLVLDCPDYTAGINETVNGAVTATGCGPFTYSGDVAADGSFTFDTDCLIGVNNFSAQVEDACGRIETCDFTVTVENDVVTCANLDEAFLFTNPYSIDLNTVYTDPDDDDLTFSNLTITPTPPDNMPTMAGGVIDWAPTANDAQFNGGDYEICVDIDDGCETVNCCWNLLVQFARPYKVSVIDTAFADFGDDIPLEEHYVNSLNGREATVGVSLQYGFVQGTGAFDFLLCYDKSVLALTGIEKGDGIADWEYFTYRTGALGTNCGSGCPSGYIRLIGIRDMNDGNTPAAGSEIVSGYIAYLTFYVTEDRSFLDFCARIGFCSIDCGDNIISDITGNEVALAFPGQNDPQGYFITFGWDYNLDSCLVGFKGVTPVTNIYFDPGYICIVPPDDDRGDINLNGIANEIGDAVLFTNYFIYGPSVWDPVWYENQILASDVNNDGIVTTVADLVYLIKIISGDAQPYPPGYQKVNPYAGAMDVTANQANGEMVVTTNASSAIGAGHLVFRYNDVTFGEITAATDDVKWNAANGELNVLVYSMQGNSVDAGVTELVSIPVEGNGSVELVEVEFGDADGSLLQADMHLAKVPTSYELLQNYPNPFNASTMIRFALPTASDWSMNIYNVAGQVVDRFEGSSDAGMVSVNWNADVASGIYFYKLTAGDFTATKKMVLMK